jgi:peptidoglycan/LPS O-acetylase OafA/YrhL
MGIIRLLLAIAVVITHCGNIFGMGFISGPVSVQAFYMISGFYMSLILEHKYSGDLKSYYYLFISNRLLRLYPLYWTVLVLSIIYSVYQFHFINETTTSTISYFKEYSGNMNLGTMLLVIFANIFLLFQDIIMFLGFDVSGGGFFFTSNFRSVQQPLYLFMFIPQTWTLGIEVLFYIIAPFFLKKKIHIILGIILLSLIIRGLLYYNGFKFDPWTYRFFPTELVFFLFGDVAFRIYKKIGKMNINKYLMNAILGLNIIYIVFATKINIPGKNIIFLLLFLSSLPIIFKLSKNWRVDRYIGDLSYSVYITHILALNFVSDLRIIENKSYLSIMVIIISIALSILLKLAIGDPIERYRQKRVIVKENSTIS